MMNPKSQSFTKQIIESHLLHQAQNRDKVILSNPYLQNVHQQISLDCFSKGIPISLQYQNTIRCCYADKNEKSQPTLQILQNPDDTQKTFNRIQLTQKNYENQISLDISSVKYNSEVTQLNKTLEQFVFDKSQIPNFSNLNQQYLQIKKGYKAVKISEGEQRWLRKSKKQFYRNKYNKMQDAFTKFQYQQLFTYYQTKIKVATGNFSNLPSKKYALLVPFTSINLEDDLANYVSQKLTYNIYQQLRKQQIDQGIRDGTILCKNSYGLNKFVGIYWAKAPIYKFQKQQQSLIYLLQCFNLGKNVVLYQNIDLLIPSFRWPCISDNEASKILIRELMKQIKKYKCYFKQQIQEVTILFNKTDQYLVYAQFLRQVSDEYVRLGMGFD